MGWCAPEILRARATQILRQGGDAAERDAEAMLERSLELARKQSAVAWELRAGLSLARIRAGRGDRAGAADLLAPVLACFTEGLGTADLREAQAFLADLEG